MVVVALLVALVVAGRGGGPDPGPGFGSAGAFVMPAADAPSALSSTWFCAAGTATEGGSADLTVVVANTAESPRAGEVTWVPSEGPPVVEPLEVDSRAVVTLSARQAVSAPVVSAVIEVRGGGVAVEHAIRAPSGNEVAPCASSASDRWFLANGATTVDAGQLLFLFNPFPDDAIVDVTFATDQGRDEPPGLVGLAVDAGTTKVVAVGDFVRRREVTATSVVARSGRLVVDRVQSFDASAGRSGLSLALAAPATAGVWAFPDGVHDEGLAERWHVYNPGDREAVASLELVPVEGEAPEPLELTVAPRTRVSVDAAESGRIPAGVAHSSTVRALNGVPVVAEREIDAREPSSRAGWSSSLGAPLSAQRWVLAVGEASDTLEEQLAVKNPGAGPVRFSVQTLEDGRVVALEGLQGVELGPSERAVFDLGELLEDTASLPLVVSADGAVVVARELDRVDGSGLSSGVGIPLG